MGERKEEKVSTTMYEECKKDLSEESLKQMAAVFSGPPEAWAELPKNDILSILSAGVWEGINKAGVGCLSFVKDDIERLYAAGQWFPLVAAKDLILDGRFGEAAGIAEMALYACNHLFLYREVILSAIQEPSSYIPALYELAHVREGCEVRDCGLCGIYEMICQGSVRYRKRTKNA